MLKVGKKYTIFQMSAILKFDFQRENNYIFLKEIV